MENNNNEEYNEKAYNIFDLLNQFRSNPRQLAHHLKKLKKYLDKSTNVLSEPGKVQFQMIEGEKVINETIKYLKKLPPIPPLEWEDALTLSAQHHVNDIGPKGILSYQSSDGTEPEDRITQYGNYMDALGENIDFGPNDEIGVIVSMALDDGEVERPHRENLFNSEYKKIGIACGAHKTEYEMCVMDFAAEFFPNKKAVNKKLYGNNYLDNIQNNDDDNDDAYQKAYNLLKASLLLKKENNINTSANYNNSSRNNISNNINNINNSNENVGNENVGEENNNTNILDNKDINSNSSKNNISIINSNNNNLINNNNLKNNPPNNNSSNNNDINSNALNHKILINNIINSIKLDEIEKMKREVKEINSHKKFIQKKIEIFTTVTYRLEDGTERKVNEVKTHIINGQN